MTQSQPRTDGNKQLSIRWHSLSQKDVLQKLETLPHQGLTEAAALKRLEEYGPNQLDEKPRRTFLQLVWSQLNSFVIYLLIGASVISAVVGDWVEALVILAIVVLNAVLGVIQESRAEEALAALKKLASPEAHVIRDGKRVMIPSHMLVPGDIVFLEAGNYVPADIRLLEAVNLRVDEAALTGESVPVQKNAALSLEGDIPVGDRKNTAFLGTLIAYGRGNGVVVSTGMHTELGLIANMLQSVEEEETPLQKRLEHLGKLLGWGTLIICAIVFLVSLFRIEFTLPAIVEVFMIAVSLAIAAVPEGLPAVVTISLALGVREMIRRHALIRRLASVETLGSATVICSDKTGTLTQNEMTVTRIWSGDDLLTITGSGYSPDGEFLFQDKPVKIADFPAVKTTLWVGSLNNDAHLEYVDGNGDRAVRMVGDPTEGSILIATLKAGANLEDLSQAYPRVQEVPFDSTRKRMVTIHNILQPKYEDLSPLSDNENKEWHAIAVKGAPDVVLNLCSYFLTRADKVIPLDDVLRKHILEANDHMTRDALRVLGMAYRIVPLLPDELHSETLEKDLIFSGMVGMIDPPRKEVEPALNIARAAGIRTIMITGDYPNTAKAIAESINLLTPEHHVLTGSQLDTMTDKQLAEEVKVTDVFARVSPEHKMRIVDALQSNGDVVAMTGDGVNDAPAIKKADIGVAMGITGTDVAKETADMVLTDDNYASIVSAIEQGRVIYSNIRKFVYYLLSCNLAEIATIFLATIFGWPSPLTAIQLLWLNLVTDGAPALALATEKGDPDIMSHKPRPPKEPIINKRMQIGMVVQTIAITAVTLTAFYLGRFTDPLHFEFAETMAFTTLSISELFRAMTARSEYYPLLKIGFFKNKIMNVAILSSLVLIIAVIYVPFFQNIFNTQPLGWLQWIEILPLLFVPSVAAELTKYVMSSRK